MVKIWQFTQNSITPVVKSNVDIRRDFDTFSKPKNGLGIANIVLIIPVTYHLINRRLRKVIVVRVER